jgi:hypothetical protein
VEQDLPLPGDVRLFLFKSGEGQWLAQYWQGLHSLMDKPHTVTVTFPPASVRIIDVAGRPRDERSYGQVTLHVGCGGHTPHRSDLVQAEPGMPMAVFRAALLAGTVEEKAGP